MKRGDVVLAVARGDYGKPRPAVIVQSDMLVNPTHASHIVCPLTTTLMRRPCSRLTVAPTPANGLLEMSQIMVDKLLALSRDRVRQRIGAVDEDTFLVLNRSLLLILGIAAG